MAEVGGISLPITAEAGQANKELDSVTASLGRIENALSGIQKSLEPLSGATQSVSRAVNRLAKDIETIHPDKFQKVADSLKTVADTATKAQDKLSTIGDGVEASTEKSSRAINSLQRDLTKTLTDMGAASQNIGQLGNVGNAAFEALADYIGHSREETTALVPVISQVTQEAEKFQQAVQNAFKMDIGGSSFDVLQRQLPAVIYSIEQIGEKATQTEQKLIGMFEHPLLTMREFGIAIRDSVPDFGENISQDTEQAISYIQQLYNEAKRLQGLISGIRAGKIFATDEQYRDLSFKLKEVQDEIKRYEKSIFEAIDTEERFETKTGGTVKQSQWKEVIAEVEKMKGDFDLLSRSIGEANAEMQILVDARNMLKKAFSDTDSGKMLWDTESMRQASAMLKEFDDKIAKAKASIADPAKLEIDVTEPINDIEKLFARLRDLNSYISDMKGNKINFTDDEFINAIEERKKVQKRIDEIEGNNKQEKDSLKWLATIIAIQHELEKVSSLFGRMGDIAKNAFLKALTPLKLIQHEFEEMKSNITRVGSGFAMVSKWILKAYSGFDGLRKKIQQTFSVKAIFGKFVSGAAKAFDELSKRWKKVAERFSFTLLRKAINSVINQLNDAIKSLALFSSEIGTNFNSSMSIVTSDVRYLAASIIALLEPLINYFTPILDGLVDQLVNVVNHVNMFVAALTGAKSFTIAKKKIIDYSKALDKANKSAKMLTLGIDELNILNDDKSAEELEDLFDWQELPTPQIDFGFLDGEIVDLIKRIIQQIKELLKAIINAIKEAWRRVADYVLSALKRLAKAILTLFSDILRDLTKLFNEEATIKLFETIFRIIGDIANVLATIVEKIDEAWNYNNLGLKILEKIRDILLVIVTHVQHVTEYMKEWAERLSFIPLFEAFLQLLTQVEYAVDQIGYVFEDLSKLILDLMEYVLEKALPEIIRFQGDIAEGIGNIAKNIHEAWTELDYGTTLFNDITAIVDTLLEHIRNVGEEFKSWTVELDFNKPVMKSFDGILQSIEPLTDALGNVFEDMFSTVLLPLVQYVLEEAAPKIMDVIADIIRGFANLTDGIHKAWQELSFGEKVVKGVSDIVNTLLDYLEKAGQAFKRWAAEVDFKPLMKGFDELLKAMQPVADFVGGTLSHVFEAFLKYVQYLVEEIFPEWEKAIAHIANATDWKNLEDIFNSLVDAGEHLSEAIGGGVVKAVENLGVAVGRFTSSKAFNDFIENLTNFVNRIDGDMVAKVLAAIGEAILKISEAVMNFANSKLVQDFLNSLLDFVNNSSTQKLANILLDIAKAFLAFKGLSAVAGGLSSVISIVPGLVELGKILSPTGALIVGIGAAVAAFALFGDTIRSIDWSKLARDLTEGFLGLLESIDWDGIGKTFGYLFAELIEFAITTSLNPAFQLRVGMTILQALVGAISGIIQGLGEAIAQFFEEIGLDIVAGLVRGIANGIAGIFDFLRGIFQGIIDFVKEILGIQSPSTVFAEIGVNLVLGLIQGITETWGLILEFFATAWQGILDWFSTTWENFKIWVSETWAGIVQAVADAWNGFIEKIQAVWDIVSGWFATKWEKFKTWAKTTWDKIIDTICSVWHDFIGKVGEIWNEILTWFDTIWSNFTQWVSETWDKITSAAADVWNFFTEKVGAIWDKIKKWFEDTWNKFKEWVAEIWQKIVQAAIDAWRNFIGDIQAVWTEIKKWFSDTWNNFKEWVGQIWDETVGTIIEAWRGFIGKISAVWDEIKKWFSDTWDAFKKWVSDKWNEIIGAIIQIWNDFVKEISGIWDEVTTFFKTLWDDIKGIWEKVWGDIIGGVKAVWDKFKQDIKRIWDNITGSIKDIWDDVSKAWKKVWEDIGNFIKDIANGIVGTVGGVINTVIRGVNKLIDFLNNLSIDIPGVITLGFNIPKIPELNIPRFATGGFPEDGLFMANHNELVGQFGNRNAVVNNQQIEAGIAQAVSSAMVPYLEQIAQNTRETADKDMTLNIDSREIARANTTGSRNLGRPLTSLN